MEAGTSPSVDAGHRAYGRLSARYLAGLPVSRPTEWGRLSRCYPQCGGGILGWRCAERLLACDGARRITRAGTRGSSQMLVAEDQLRHFFDLSGDLNALPGSAFLLQIQLAQLMEILPGLFCTVPGSSRRQCLWMVRG